MSVLILQKENGRLRAAVTEQGKLYAYYEQDGGFSIAEDQIYLGVADRAIKGVNAVFVRLPDGQFGFLPTPDGQKPPASGEKIMVQVKRPPTAVKKAMLSRDIALAGLYLVYLPLRRGARISSKVEDPAERAALKRLGKALGLQEEGAILRSSALECAKEQALGELDTLRRRWQEILAASRTAAPALLYGGEDVPAVCLRDEGKYLEYILTNAPEAIKAPPGIPVRTCDTPFLLHNIDHKLERACRRTVLLKSGASLIFDQCEAMTVIDVNSAMAPGGKNIAVTAEKINMEAAAEIARLLRLRGIGGIILVDFIDMETEEAKERLIAHMRECLKHDPMKTVVYGVTQLGLMEMTRRRAARPLATYEDLPCPHCAGSGILLQPPEEDIADERGN